MSAAAGWKGTIVQVRFDPTNNNGKYYIDSIVFSAGAAPKVEAPKEPKWYDMYVDYAVANKIITKTTFADYNKNITRADLAHLFAAALPASYFNAINDIKGIPDVNKNDKYAKELLMLYNAGVVLGDADGNFKQKADMFTKRTIKRAEVVTSVDTAIEALAVSLSEKAKVTLPRNLCDASNDEHLHDNHKILY